MLDLSYPLRRASDPHRDGRWQLITFREIEHGRFVGAVADPVPLEPVIERFRSARRAQ